MTERQGSLDLIERECRVYCRYLIGKDPDQYILRKYREGYLKTGIEGGGDSPFDNLVMSLARINPVFTCLADTYTRFFLQNSSFRKKLILLLAILESYGPTYSYIDSTDDKGKAWFYLGSVYRVFVFGAALFISVVFFLPLHLVYSMLRRFDMRLWLW